MIATPVTRLCNTEQIAVCRPWKQLPQHKFACNGVMPVSNALLGPIQATTMSCTLSVTPRGPSVVQAQTACAYPA
jgi:hypothetical protein